MIPVPFEPEVRNRTRGTGVRTLGFGALVANDQPSAMLDAASETSVDFWHALSGSVENRFDHFNFLASDFCCPRAEREVARCRQAEGGSPTIFLKARLKAGSDS
jgi:hypothetical protein